MTLSQPIKKSSPNVLDYTDQYVNTAEANVLEGWIAELTSKTTTVDFSKPAKRGDQYLWINRGGGKHELTSQGTSVSSTIFRLSVPKDTEPGRYIFEATFLGKGKQENPLRTEFIVEVL